MLNQGYGILPNAVLFDSELSSSAKLLFVYISSLCATEGYCWASNKHFAQRFGISESQVSRLIAELSKYLTIKNARSPHRTMALAENLPTQKAQSNISKNAGHNSTSGIKKNKQKKATNSSPTARLLTPQALGMPDLASDFYAQYDLERPSR